MILIGSRAAKAWFPDARQPSDWDAIGSVQEIAQWSHRNEKIIRALYPRSHRKMKCVLRDGTKIEFEILMESGSTSHLASMQHRFKPSIFPGGEALAATPAILWLTKRSHIYWSVHWFKSINDLHWIKNRAAPATEEETEYYKARLSEHVGRMGEAKAKLNMSNANFFAKSDKAIQRVIEHDRLHEIVAYENRPMFERFKTDLGKASLSRALFELADQREKLRLVREEAMVIALERYIIPNPGIDPAFAYRMALKRICTNLTSGWFRDFAIDQWPFLHTPDKDFSQPVLSMLSGSQKLV